MKNDQVNQKTNDFSTNIAFSTLKNGSEKYRKFTSQFSILLFSFLSILVIFLCTILTVYHIGKNQFKQRISYQVPSSLSEERYYFQNPVSASSLFSGLPSSITYHNQLYKRNPNLIVLYLMGIDSDSPVSSTAITEGGQSDANFLLFIDTKIQTIRISSINRNAVTDVDIYDTFDKYGYTIPAQLCLQHAYGDGLAESCERSSNALSRLLYDMPINGYYALQKGAITALNDDIGGVRVTALEDVIFPEPETIIHKGDDILLLGSNAYYYLTFRYIENFGSNNGRLDRERQYINAFLQQSKDSIIDHPFILFKCISSIKKYSVTDLSIPEMFYLSSLCNKYAIDTSIYNLPGETKLDGTYETYEINEEDLTSFILNYYYIKQ